MSEEKIKCPKCGAENNNTDSFCAECGYSLSKDVKKEINKNSIIQNNENIAMLDNVGLTNEQVYQVYSQLGQEYFISIFLKDVSSIELGYTSHPILILLALILGFGIYFYFQSTGMAWTVGIILMIIYFVTRQSVLRISSHGNNKIVHHINSNNRVKEFIKQVIEAKKRYL